VRVAVLQAGASLLEELLQPVGVGRRDTPVRCSCGAVMASTGICERRVQTLLGWIDFRRSRYQCPRCGAVRYPGDEELGLQNSRSPGILRQVARLGAKESFAEVSRDLHELACVDIPRKEAERIAEGVGEAMEAWMARERVELRFQEPPPPESQKTIDTLYIEFDGTGVPMVPHELEGRKGKQENGAAKTREAKLGCLFTQTTYDEKGRPIRDDASASFVGAIESAAPFGWRLYAEAVRRGLFTAKRVVCLTDGAQWIRNIIQTHFGIAILHIIDLYHAREHLSDLCKLLFDRDLKRLNRYKDRWWDYLDEGNIEKIIQEAQPCLPRGEDAAEKARTAVGYFETNKDRMRYADYKKQGLFVGSGVIEAACRTIVGQRLKQSGMEWTERGANAIIALRCVEQSNRTEDYWEARAS
jgi:hypothetical protein